MGLCESCAAEGRRAEPRDSLIDPLLQPVRDRLWQLTEEVQEQTTDVHRFEEQLNEERQKLEEQERILRRKRHDLSLAAQRQRKADRAFQHMWQSQRWSVAFQGFYTMLLCLERRRKTSQGSTSALGKRVPLRALMLIRDFCVQRTATKAILLRTAGSKHLCCVEERRDAETDSWRYYMFHDSDADDAVEERARRRGAAAYSIDEDPKFLLSAKATTSVVGHRYLISLCPDAAAFRSNVIATLRSDAFGLRWTLVRHNVSVSYMDADNKVRRETGDEELVHIIYNQNITRSAPASLRVYMAEHGPVLRNGAPEHPTSFNLVERVRAFHHDMESGRARKLYHERRRKRRRAGALDLLRQPDDTASSVDDGEESKESRREASVVSAELSGVSNGVDGDAPVENADVPEELVRSLTAKHYGLRELVNAEPQWRADLEQFTLDFGGRVKESSARNFQLVLAESSLAAGAAGFDDEFDSDERQADEPRRLNPPRLPEDEGAPGQGAPGQGPAGDGARADADLPAEEAAPGDAVVYQDASKVLLQFGRVVPKRNVGTNAFSLDFDAPFSPLAAFALALAQSTTKIAC